MIFIDLETYSTLDLTQVGLSRYSKNCEILLLAYAVDDGPVQVFDFTSGS